MYFGIKYFLRNEEQIDNKGNNIIEICHYIIKESNEKEFYYFYKRAIYIRKL